MADSEDDVGDLSVYMEVVTLFKCKFCDFTAVAAKELGHHVRSVHVKKRPPVINVEQQIAGTKTVIPSNVIIIPGLEEQHLEANLKKTSLVLSSANSTPMPQYTVNNIEETASNAMTVAAGLITSLSASEQVLPITMTTESIVDPSHRYNDYHFISQNSEGQFILQTSENMQFGNNGTVQVLVQESSEIDQDESFQETIHEDFDQQNNADIVKGAAETCAVIAQPGPDSYRQVPIKYEPSEVEEEFTGEEALKKEIFLCANCQQAFLTMQDCKSHMLQEHDNSDFSTSARVDTGTQMEPKKKVGRKRKSEKVATENENPEEPVVMSESDEDWTEQLLAYTTRSQRKRQPPKSLKQDYYLGRARKKEPKKRAVVLITTNLVRCSVKGCTAQFRLQETLEKHVQCHIHDAEFNGPQFRCTECSETFFVWKTVRYHMWKVHKIDFDLLTCDICEHFKTDTVSKLKIHMEVHGVERPYVCNLCQQGYKQLSQLKNHQTCHLDDETRTLAENQSKWYSPKVCDVCDRTFVNLKCLKKHKETVHSGKKPFKCTFCSHACSRKAMMILHMRTHTGDKPHKCDQCPYSCSDHNSLRRHKMRHTGHKPYQCPHCSYACIQAISLKVHVKNKHPGMGGVFACHLCMYRTINKLNFDNHLQDHKNNLVETTVLNLQYGQQMLLAQPGQDQPAQGQSTEIQRSHVSLIRPNIRHNPPDLHDVQSISNDVPVENIVTESYLGQILQQNPTCGALVIHMPDMTDGTLPNDNLEQVTSQLQVQMNEGEDNIESAEDLVRLASYAGVDQADDVTTQLIYMALSAITQNVSNDNCLDSQNLVAGVQNGDIQTSVETNSKEGVTTHTITFHLPDGEDLSKDVTLQELPNIT